MADDRQSLDERQRDLGEALEPDALSSEEEDDEEAFLGSSLRVGCCTLGPHPARYFRRYVAHPEIKTFVDGVTAAAIGAIAGAGMVLAQRALTDATAWIIAVATAVLMWRAHRIPEPVIVIAAAIAGTFAAR